MNKSSYILELIFTFYVKDRCQQQNSDILWSYPDGSMVIAPMTDSGQPNLNNKGSFRLFEPGR